MLVDRRSSLSLSAVGLLFALLCVAACSEAVDPTPQGGTGGAFVPVTGGVGGTMAGASGMGAGMVAPTGGTGGTGGTMVTPTTGGVGGMMMGTGGGMAMDDGGIPEPPGELAMDECNLDTGFPGDEYCILPPPPEQGFQLHIGPSNYDSPEAQYILAAGQEITNSFAADSTNTTDVFFLYRQFRMRPGAHHNIITTTDGGGFGTGRRIGTVNALAEDSPKGGINAIAPENAGVGIPLAPHSAIDVSLHSINTTGEPQLREIWVNFWYRNPAEVTDPVEEMFQTGSVSFQIPPGADQILGPFSCNVTGDGRMLWMYGHRHANNVRFSTWRVRGAQRDLIYEAYHWEDPLVLEYSSTVTNAAPVPAMGLEGGWSGILDFKTGDKLEWECHIINQTNGVLAFTNNTYTGEMCIVDAELVGANCAAGFP